MNRCNLRLQMISGELFSARCLLQVGNASDDHGAIPQAAVPLVEEDQVSQRVGPRRQSRRLKQHQRQERVALRMPGRGILGQRLGQANRFGAQIVLDQEIPAVAA